jgi:ribosomal protein S3
MALRIDKYVWAVRLTKTRSQASELISKGKIKINEMDVKPSRDIKMGDTINIHKNSAVFSYKVLELLEKRVAFRKAIKKAIGRAQAAKVLGIKVQVSGRLNGAEMARTEWIREGRVPLQTLRADIDYATREAHTIYGVLGIKVWLFKNEILTK